MDLLRTTQIGGFAEGDVLVSIENVGGSSKMMSSRATAESKRLFGNSGSDIMEGRDGDDRLIGDGSNGDLGGSSIFGGVNGQGNDVLDGGAGNDELFGGGKKFFLKKKKKKKKKKNGNDTLIGGSGLNTLDGGVRH